MASSQHRSRMFIDKRLKLDKSITESATGTFACSVTEAC